MKRIALRILLILGIVFLLAVIMVVILNIDDSNKADKQERRRQIIGDVRFKGKVISAKNYDFGGRNYYMLCIKLDFSTKNNFYVFNDLCALKIKNGVATCSGNFYNPDVGYPTYVEVNMNEDGRSKFYFNHGLVHEIDWLVPLNDMPQEDMNFCN